MRAYEIVFSPTGGTKKVADALTASLADEVETVDLCDQNFDGSKVQLSEGALAVIAVPSFGGRVPEIAAHRLASIEGRGLKSVLVCVYGNRAYEDTLIELQDITQKAGFSNEAAVAAIAEHSIAHQFAAGRPDADDVASLKEFAGKIRAKIDAGDESVPKVPGNHPYRSTSPVGMVPKANRSCVQCGTCAKECPAGAIDPTDAKKVDSKKCNSCMRCVAVCPHQARGLGSVMMGMVGAALKKSCSVRKDNELFI